MSCLCEAKSTFLASDAIAVAVKTERVAAVTSSGPYAVFGAVVTTALELGQGALPPAPTPQQLLPIAPEIASTVSAADSLKSATSSACD